MIGLNFGSNRAEFSPYMNATSPSWESLDADFSAHRDHDRSPLSRPSATLSPALGGGEGRQRGRAESCLSA